jgi:hypothetical protein
METEMTDNLYERDVLEWSECQAELLRQVASGERRYPVDWTNIIEEIISVGVAQLNDVRGLLRQAMLYLVRIHLNAPDERRGDWELELGCSLDDAADQLTPSMRGRIGLDLMWERVRARTTRQYDDPRARALPDHCPWTLDALMENDPDRLLSALAGWPMTS